MDEVYVHAGEKGEKKERARRREKEELGKVISHL